MAVSSAGSTPFIVTETDDLDHADTDGTVTVEPGETVVIADYRLRNEQVGIAHVLGYGATDEADTDYIFEVDDSPRFSTRSPLGLVNNPMSFKNDLGYAYPFEKYVTLKVSRDANASGSQKYAARMFVTEGGI